MRLLTHLVVREDAHVLYGFATEDERRLFRSLIRVSGVGPKIALALLSGISVEAFAQCVLSEDIAALTRVPGVGRKTAERLIVEMRDRLAAPLGVRTPRPRAHAAQSREGGLRGPGGTRLPPGRGHALAQSGRSRYTFDRGTDSPCPAGRGAGVDLPVVTAERIISAAPSAEEEAVERAIRPRRLAEYVGQAPVKTQLEIFITRRAPAR